MSALLEKKKPFAQLFVFFLLLFADRFFVLAQDGATFSDASTPAFEDSRFAKNMDELPDELWNDGSIGFTKNGNLTLTLLKNDDKKICIPLVARNSSGIFLFRASLDNCTIDKGSEKKWNLSYLGKGDQKVELNIIWNQDVFKLVNGSNEASVLANSQDEVDVFFDKSMACVREEDATKTNERKGMLHEIVPVDMQAMKNGTFSLSISRLAGSKEENCSIILEFDKDKFGLPKLEVTTATPIFDDSTIANTPLITDESTTATTPEFDDSTMDSQASPVGTNSLWYIIVGAILLILCLIGIGIGIYFFIKRRRDKSKDPEKNSAPPVDDSKLSIGVSSFSTTMTTMKTPDTPGTSINSKADRVSETKSTGVKEPLVKEGAKIVKATAADKKSNKGKKVANKKVLEKEDKKKSSKSAKAAEGQPDPKGKKINVTLVDVDNSLNSSSEETPGTDYENYKWEEKQSSVYI